MFGEDWIGWLVGIVMLAAGILMLRFMRPLGLSGTLWQWPIIGICIVAMLAGLVLIIKGIYFD